MSQIKIERTQIGVRLEKRMLKVLKALAEYHDISLGALLKTIVLHAFTRSSPFHEEGIQKINALKEVYGMDYGIGDAHNLVEENEKGTSQ